MKLSSLRLALVVPVAAIVVGCTSSGIAPNPPGGILTAKMFVANRGNDSVYEYPAPYTGTPTVPITGLDGPYGVAVLNSSGDLFVASAAGGSAPGNVEVYAPPYTGSPVTTITSGIDQPIGIALGSHGDLWVANCGSSCTLDGTGSGSVVEYTPPYTGAPAVTITSGIDGADFVALDKSGDVWVSNFAGGDVTEYTAPYTGTAALTLTTDTAQPYGLAVNASGNLFLCAETTVEEFVPPYTGAPTTPITSGLDGPFGLSFDSSGNLYVSNENNTITEYAPPYTAAPVATISNGLDAPAETAFLK